MSLRFILVLLSVAFVGFLSATAGGQLFGPTANHHSTSAFDSTLSHVEGLQARGAHCGPLTRELVQRVAKNNSVMLTVVDRLVWSTFGLTYLENVRSAKISYWLIAALDLETSMALAAMGVEQCFTVQQERLKYTGSDMHYKWGGHHWTQTTWNKVHVMRAVYELGVHVVHSDADVVWFSDPLPFFHAQLGGPAHVLISTDAVWSANGRGDTGLEAGIHLHTHINTGVYFLRQWPGGLGFIDEWLGWQDRNVGHDQHGFNVLARGYHYRRDPAILHLNVTVDRVHRCFNATYSRNTSIAFLPVSMFANTYTYVNARLWEKLDHPVYAVHWVWGGNTVEGKRQNMRDAMKFHDDPDYYTAPYLVSFDLDQIPMPYKYNEWSSTERMIRFHAQAANHQLQQTYFAFAAALITNRTLVMPKFLCYCSKNWFFTQQCRINHERATTFPFVCSLSQLLRVKRLQQGFELPGNTEYAGHKTHIREYSFLENPKVPERIKHSYVEVVPSALPRPPGLRPEQLVLSVGPSSRGFGRRITVAAPLSDGELRAVLAQFRRARLLHFPQPGRTLAGFSRADTQAQFDEEMQKRATYWCCRSPPDMQAMNLSAKVQLAALPPERQHALPRLQGAEYAHQLGPVREAATTKRHVT